MATHGNATLGEFAELAGIIMRALPRAIDGLDMRETIRLADTCNEQLSGFLREVLTSLKKPRQDHKAEEPIAPALPTEFTIGGHTYELVSFLKKGESLVRGNTMMDRAMELGANLGEEDGTFILEHQDEIPQKFRGKFYLVFTAWRNPSNPRSVACFYWDGYCWYQCWDWLDAGWDESTRLVRCRPSTRA